jgi:hypothetical protein
MSNADVATQLFISQETVKSHVRHILAKLEAGHAHACRSPLPSRSDHRLVKQSSTSSAEPETIVAAEGEPAERVLAAEQDERRRIALFSTTAQCSRSRASRSCSTPPST